MSKIIPIALISSEEFAEHCATCIASIISNVSKNCNLIFHVCTDNMTKRTQKKIKDLQNQNCKIEIEKINKSDLLIFEKIYRPQHVSILTYIRLLCPILFKQYDKMLYIDADTIVRDDISKLYNIDLEDKYFGAVIDANYEKFSNELTEHLKQKISYYFNCGILSINSKLMRENNYLDDIKENIEKYGKLYKICDQSVINFTFYNKIKKLDLTWNFYHNEHPFCNAFKKFNQNEYNVAISNPAIVHFCGIYKPWYLIFEHNYKKEYLSYKKKTLFYKKIKLQKFSVNGIEYKVLSVCDNPVFKFTNKNLTEQINFNKIVKSFLQTIFSIKNVKERKIIKILGIKISLKQNANILSNKLDLLIHQNNLCQTEIINLKTIIIAQNLHSETFGKYKNAFTGKDVVLVCTGPTAKNYNPIPGAIHVGVNGAIYLDKIKLDYLFVQDYTADQSCNKELNDDCNNYIGNNCQKFYGIIPDNKLKLLKNCPIGRIPLAKTIGENIHQYILEDKLFGNFAYDCSLEPIGNFEGTPFSALQFILYTNPKRIFLVGCDCSSGYAYEKPNAIQPANYQKEIWINHIKPYIDKYHREKEIISINPIGLKGVFNDLESDSNILENLCLN